MDEAKDANATVQIQCRERTKVFAVDRRIANMSAHCIVLPGRWIVDVHDEAGHGFLAANRLLSAGRAWVAHGKQELSRSHVPIFLIDPQDAHAAAHSMDHTILRVQGSEGRVLVQVEHFIRR